MIVCWSYFDNKFVVYMRTARSGLVPFSRIATGKTKKEAIANARQSLN